MQKISSNDDISLISVRINYHHASRFGTFAISAFLLIKLLMQHSSSDKRRTRFCQWLLTQVDVRPLYILVLLMMSQRLVRTSQTFCLITAFTSNWKLGQALLSSELDRPKLVLMVRLQAITDHLVKEIWCSKTSKFISLQTIFW